MDTNQIILSAILLVMVGMFIWGRYRYDAVALTSLAVLVVLGFVPAKEAFVGFGHPAVITVALVLLISKGLEASGLIGKIGSLLQKIASSEFQFLVILDGNSSCTVFIYEQYRSYGNASTGYFRNMPKNELVPF